MSNPSKPRHDRLTRKLDDANLFLGPRICSFIHIARDRLARDRLAEKYWLNIHMILQNVRVLSSIWYVLCISAFTIYSKEVRVLLSEGSSDHASRW